MKTKWIVSLLVILFGLSLLFNTKAKAGVAASVSTSNSNDIRQRILDATVLIEMRVELSSSGSNIEYVTARGIGSLVQYGGETLLVTHNHWGDELQEKTVVEISDAQGQHLVELYGFQFFDLVRYQDPGTLVLETPASLVIGDSALGLGEGREARIDDIATLVYRQAPGRETAGLQEAQVIGISRFKGLPRYELSSLSGTPILPGDSGGGMWMDGKLVGNIWTTVQSEEVPDLGETVGSTGQPSFQPTGISTAAIFPMDARLDSADNSWAAEVDETQKAPSTSGNELK